MKHFFTTLLLTIASIACTAQIQRHTFVISSSFSYNKESVEIVGGGNDGYFVKTVDLQPKVGYFALKRFCVGIYMPYTWRRTTSQGPKLTSKRLGVGPFVRYYQPIVKNLYGIGAIGFAWNNSSNEYLDSSIGPVDPTSSIYEIKSSNKSTLMGIGLAYFVNRNIALEMMLDHQGELTDDNTEPYIYREDFTLSLGLQIYLTKNRE